MPVYTTTYPFEAEFIERDETGALRRDTVEIPYINSDQFFTIMGSPQIKAVKDGLSELELVSVFGRLIANSVMPGLLERLSPKSGIALVTLIFEKEKDTFGLGEPQNPTASTDSTETS